MSPPHTRHADRPSYRDLADLGAAGVYRIADIIRVEQAALRDGLPLMERAGRAIADLIHDRYPKAQRIAVVAGPGNNGGDAWVCARHLRQRGIRIDIACARGSRSDEARRARQDFIVAGGEASPEDGAINRLDALEQADVIVDGLLGTGVSGPVKSEYGQIIEAMNGCGADIVAIDLPSGMRPDTGEGDSVCARHTMACLALKNGLFSKAGADKAGRIHLADLAIDRSYYQDTNPMYELAAERPRLRRQADSHKGDYGQLWIYGGQGYSEGAGMAGAALLAARAASRCGCGLVRVFSHRDHLAALVADFAEGIYHDAASDYSDNADQPSVAGLIGPGLGRSRWSEDVFERAIKTLSRGVIDADGLNMLAERDGFQGQRSWVLTPHPKEAARLLDCPVGEVQGQRIDAVREIARRYQCIAVLKGRATLVSDGERVLLCPFGNPGMSSAGMGDALAGIIGALMAQGLPPIDAAGQGAALHSYTADRLLPRLGWGMAASDLVESLRLVACEPGSLRRSQSGRQGWRRFRRR